MDTSGKTFIEHWDWAAEKGLMNKNTANALRASSYQILEIIDDWETVDIREIDVEAIFRRFQNLKGKEYKPQTLNAYKRRFRQAVSYFLEYVNDPSNWKGPTSKSQSNQRTKNDGRQKASKSRDFSTSPSVNSMPQSFGDELVSYPYPLRENLVVYLHLPSDLKNIEVRKLMAFMTTLTVDFEVDDIMG